LPDILTQEETWQLINIVRKLRYRVFFLTVYSMGLRLGEGIMILLSELIEGFESELLKRYGHRLLPRHRRALAAMKQCRTERSPRMLTQCRIANTSRVNAGWNVNSKSCCRWITL